MSEPTRESGMTREQMIEELVSFRYSGENVSDFYERVIVRGIPRHPNGAIPHDWRTRKGTRDG